MNKVSINERLIHWGGNKKVEGIGNVGIIANGSGDLTFGVEVFYPPIYVFSEEEYNVYIKAFDNFFKSFFSGLYVQVLDFYSVEKHKNNLENKTGISKHTHKEIKGKPVLKHKSFWLFTLLLNENHNINIDYSKVMLKRKINTSKYNKKKYQEYYNKFLQNITVLYNSFRELDYIEINILEIQEIRSVAYNYFNQSYDDWEEYTSKSRYEPLTFVNNDLQIGDHKVGINAFTSFPDTVGDFSEHLNFSSKSQNDFKIPKIKLPKSNYYPIHLGTPKNHIVSTTFFCTDKEKALQRINKEYSGDIIISLLNKSEFEAKKKYVKATKEDESPLFEKEMLETGSLPYVFSQIVISKHYDKEKLYNTQQFVKRAYKSFGSNSIIENGIAAHRFLSHYPGNIPYEQVGNYLTLSPQIVRSLSLETHIRSDSNGYLFFDRMENPLIIDPNEPLEITLFNHNMLIFGDSGTGKSFFLNGLIDQLYGLGAHLVVLDIGGSYKELAKVLDIKYIDGSDKKSLAFNPFLNCSKGQIEGEKYPIYLYNKDLKDKALKNQNKEEDNFDFAIESVFAIIDSIVSGTGTEKDKINHDTATSIKIAIAEYYKETNSQIIKQEKNVLPSITGFYHFLKKYQKTFISQFGKIVNFDSLFLRMHEYVDNGRYSWLLNTHKNIDFNKDRAIIIDVQDIQKDPSIYNIMCVCICEIANKKFELLPKEILKFFCIDEAVDFFKGKNMGDYIGALFRQIRKFGGMVGIATQNASYLNSLEELAKKSILTNSDTRVILGMKEGSMQEAKELLSLTDGDEKKIRSMIKGKDFREFFIKFGYDSYILRNKASKYAYWIFTTNPKERSVREKRTKKYYGNIETALQELINEDE